jgi:lipopolysaccharide transport system permease protein
MAAVAYESAQFRLEPGDRRISARFRVVNHSSDVWRRADGYTLGWQLFDPDTGTFITEGEWNQLEKDLAPAETADVAMELTLPPEKGRYHVYISLLQESTGWFYEKGAPFLLLEASVEGGQAEIVETGVKTLRSLRRRGFWRGVRRALTYPFLTIWNNASLIRSMVRRDILARYRGSFGDVFWTILNPLLLTLTYFFVFGIMMRAPGVSRSAFALYFLAGMLPWLPFSEAVGRAPSVLLEYRNFVKKLVFPVETLPVNHVLAGFVTEGFTLIVFLIFLLIARGSVPPTVLWIPVLLVPQFLFTVGVGWFLSALGIFMRDLGQIIGFILTFWFFITPICYPETQMAQLPHEAVWILSKNPIYILVRGYRAILLDGHAPEWQAMWKLWLASGIVCILGHAWFYKLRSSFADVL